MARERHHRESGSSGKKRTRQKTFQSDERVDPNDHILINEFLFKRGEISLAAEIVSFLTDHEGERFRSVELAHLLGYRESRHLPGFWYVLHKLQEDGTVDKDSNRCYGMHGMELASYEEVLEHARQFPVPGKERFTINQTYTGRLSTHPNGYGFVDVDGFDDDIFVKANDLHQAIHGDEVDVVVSTVPDTYAARATPHQRCEGIVVGVVRRSVSSIVGTLSRANRKFLLKPDQRKLLPEVVVPIRHAAGAKDGQKVLVGDLDFRKPGIIGARVLEILGSAGESRVEVSAIARNYGIDETFEDTILTYTSGIKEGVTKKDLHARLDIRRATVFTIDPLDAKDFDDALSVESLGDNLYRIGVHIADVSHYVPENSLLDREAMKRSNSVYLVDRVIPMLPSRLSENICSLNPGVDRMAFSVFFTMTGSGEIREHEFHKTVIRSKRRFTYEDVEEILLSGEGEYVGELQVLEKISERLREKRFRSGGLDFETEEVRFRLGSNGEPLEVLKKERLSSHRLIEEFMLLANRKVAEHLTLLFRTRKKKAQPVIYRVHDAPQQERVMVLAKFVRKIGYDLKLNRGKKGPVVTATALRELLRQVKGTNVEFLVNELVLRCMSKAVYTDENAGHYGLGFEYYTHFTSPIRRYPDLIVHRLLAEYETLRKQRKTLSDARVAELQEKIRQVSRIANEREKNAAEAERESIKLKQVEYIAAHLGKVFQGVISGATEYGIYVRMVDFAIEGLVHMRNLTDDYYEYDETSYSLVGKRRKRRLQVGQKIKVKVHAVDMPRRTIDLVVT